MVMAKERECARYGNMTAFVSSLRSLCQGGNRVEIPLWRTHGFYYIILSIYLVNSLKVEALDIKSQILATPKTFVGYGHAVWLRPAKFLELYEFIFEEKPCYTDLLIDMAVHLTNVRVYLKFENKTLSKTRVFSRGRNLKKWGHMALVLIKQTKHFAIRGSLRAKTTKDFISPRSWYASKAAAGF